ncbi:hypothetical protein PIIN_10085 [Serendipita indica DSM 11827]|uniref:Uncharacterized protein n=1 Tax=Serendipita indica (strain DSM 11827) TaxID=1109443 RepID=G4TXP2_SERID|nr:hypothetical protein PIIN_10085 [Serendipita indica DSM 11827]
MASRVTSTTTSLRASNTLSVRDIEGHFQESGTDVESCKSVNTANLRETVEDNSMSPARYQISDKQLAARYSTLASTKPTIYSHSLPNGSLQTVPWLLHQQNTSSCPLHPRPSPKSQFELLQGWQNYCRTSGRPSSLPVSESVENVVSSFTAEGGVFTFSGWLPGFYIVFCHQKNAKTVTFVPVLPLFCCKGGDRPNVQPPAPHNFKEDNIDTVLPDKTIGALLDKLAAVHGNNIVERCQTDYGQTVIFDCCNSGSITRGKSTAVHRRVCGLGKLKGVISPQINEDIWAHHVEAHCGHNLAKGFLHSSLSSHVLLTTCGTEEMAKEYDNGGAFTSALLKLLSSVCHSNVIYTKLIHHLPSLPGQNTQCEGHNRGRICFDSKAPVPKKVWSGIKTKTQYINNWVFYKIKIDGGTAHGITTGAQFALYSSLTPEKGENLGEIPEAHRQVAEKRCSAINSATYRAHWPERSPESADSPWYPHCGERNFENLMHILYICPKYREARREWERSLQEKTKDLKEVLGSEEGIAQTLKFLRKTGRLRTRRTGEEE